jgi:pyruvate/2-oxoglutarate dehydrogenase complex dihydrolipoamide acyltransferase (E2) component
MSDTIIMPQLGETVAEGKILTWFKAVGDAVKAGDKLFEVETDKVTVEVEAIVSGTLQQIKVGPGVSAKVGAVVAVVGEGPGLAATPDPVSTKTSTPAPNAGLAPFAEVATPLARYGKATGPGDLRLTPLARRVLATHGLAAGDISRFASSQGLRKIHEADVQNFLKTGPIAAQQSGTSGGGTTALLQPAFSGNGEVIALNTVRARTGERLAENWRTIPHVFQAIEADFTAVEAVRARYKEKFKAETGASLTYLPFIARATCLALHSFPRVNARFDGKSLFVERDINLGIAVDLSFNGLVVPVVRNAGDLSLQGLAKAILHQIERARTNKLTADDFVGGTYSITNNGAFGTLFTAPIINAPQVAILSTDAIRKRPVVVSTPEGDFIAPRLTGMLGQSFDHRAFDGAYAAAFLSKLKETIETRAWEAELN